MKIVATFIFLTISLCATNIFAKEWQYDIKDALQETTTKNGEKQFTLDIKVIDYYLERIAFHAKDYPPHFNNRKEKYDVKRKLNQLINVLETASTERKKDPKFLLKSGQAYNMAYNLNIKGSEAKTKDTLENLLAVDPNNKKGNYLYGMFLVYSDKYHFESIPYLEKALSLGNANARFTLGLLYVHKGEKEKGIKYLEKFALLNPNNEYVRRVLNAVKSDRLQFKNGTAS